MHENAVSKCSKLRFLGEIIMPNLALTWEVSEAIVHSSLLRIHSLKFHLTTTRPSLHPPFVFFQHITTLLHVQKLKIFRKKEIQKIPNRINDVMTDKSIDVLFDQLHWLHANVKNACFRLIFEQFKGVQIKTDLVGKKNLWIQSTSYHAFLYFHLLSLDYRMGKISLENSNLLKWFM